MPVEAKSVPSGLAGGHGTGQLSRDDIHCVEETSRELAMTAPGMIDDPMWVAAVRHGWDDLPAGLRRMIRRFRRDSGPDGTLLLRGLPVDESSLPDTPLVAGSVQRAATVPAATLVVLACGLGDPVAYQAEKHGALVQDVVPVPGKEDVQGNVGSVALSFHNENAFHQHRPDYVMLLCLRADHDRTAGLRCASTRTVLPLLSARATAALSEPAFVTVPPPSFGLGEEPAIARPVLSGAADDPDLRVDLAATRPLQAEGAAALAELAELLNRTARTVRLTPGDLVIVDNRVAVHGRTPFRPRYDGRDRWLQRTFVCTDLRRSRAIRPGDGYVVAA